MRKKIKAFTLVELIVAVTISSVVLLGLLKIVGDTIYQLSYANNSSQLIVDLNALLDVMNDYNTVYDYKEILINSNPGEGGDVIFYRNNAKNSGVIFGVVDPFTKKLMSNSQKYGLYNYKHIGYRKLSSSDITALELAPQTVNNYTFLEDKMYKQLPVTDFQFTEYNSGSILELQMGLLINYSKDAELEGDKISDLSGDSIYSINVNF